MWLPPLLPSGCRLHPSQLQQPHALAREQPVKRVVVSPTHPSPTSAAAALGEQAACQRRTELQEQSHLALLAKTQEDWVTRGIRFGWQHPSPKERTADDDPLDTSTLEKAGRMPRGTGGRAWLGVMLVAESQSPMPASFFASSAACLADLLAPGALLSAHALTCCCLLKYEEVGACGGRIIFPRESLDARWQEVLRLVTRTGVASAVDREPAARIYFFTIG